MSLFDSLPELSEKVFALRDQPGSEYGDFVFLRPAPDLHALTGQYNAVSLDGAREGGDALLLSLLDFSGRVVDIEFSGEHPETRELLAQGLSCHLGQLAMRERNVTTGEG